jgi:hypothetical protein
MVLYTGSRHTLPFTTLSRIFSDFLGAQAITIISLLSLFVRQSTLRKSNQIKGITIISIINSDDGNPTYIAWAGIEIVITSEVETKYSR